MAAKQNIQQKINLRDYKDLIETIAKVEYQKFSSSHLIELPELINIGNHTLYILFKNHSPENYNNTFSMEINNASYSKCIVRICNFKK